MNWILTPLCLLRTILVSLACEDNCLYAIAVCENSIEKGHNCDKIFLWLSAPVKWTPYKLSEKASV